MKALKYTNQTKGEQNVSALRDHLELLVLSIYHQLSRRRQQTPRIKRGAKLGRTIATRLKNPFALSTIAPFFLVPRADAYGKGEYVVESVHVNALSPRANSDPNNRQAKDRSSLQARTYHESKTNYSARGVETPNRRITELAPGRPFRGNVVCLITQVGHRTPVFHERGHGEISSSSS